MVRKVWTVVALASTLALSGCGSNNLFDPTRMLSVFAIVVKSLSRPLMRKN